ncbi:hypothetical protein GCM10011506_29500 [Marivirga lumbricoides]|uniref:Uncharacterized protein n=2 Tax=Marivirga lumbricoides TaxID=1046115 RepID=A0ABQ1MKD4_9BACT|nr:hypothetical protein GCM10011506_29500 [Marivirga lumbricoides]
MKESKVKTSRKTKVKGNPNKSINKVKRIKPNKWNWNKILWFKAKKSDYKTYDYNPNKKTKFKQYDNTPNYETARRKPGDSDVKLKDPLIPFDSRVSEEGPVLLKKREMKGKKKGEDKKLYTKRDDKKRKPMDNDRLEVAKKQDHSDNKLEDKKLMVSSAPDYKKNKMDDDKLLTSKVDRGKKAFDDKKLMTSKVDKDKSPSFDDKKMMTIKVDKDKPKPFDDKKLMTVEVAKSKNQSLHDDRLLVTVPKIKRATLDGDKLLTVEQRHYPTATMKRVSDDIAKYDGNYERYFNITKNSHPGTLYMSSKGHRMPWLKRTQIAVSLFWSGLWDSNIQPKYVTEKKPKHRRDKNEGKIWDNSVHPDEWRNAEAKPESGQKN